MRSLLTFAAFLPAALTMGIAACEKPAEAPPVDVSAEAAAPPPPVAADARRLEYAGTYSQVAADGKVTTLKLGRDDTYEWSEGDGRVTRGKFAWYRDGSRILLDAKAGNAVYALADGAAYKLADKDAPLDTLAAEQMWKRDAN